MLIDTLITLADNGLKTLYPPLPTINRPQDETTLSKNDRAHAAALMRINHVGEICAQALYQAQALSTKNPSLKETFLTAAKEEEAHLDWTSQRVAQLGGHLSRLNPLWYLGASTIGLIAGRFGDKVSLGFMAETERQVEAHLQSHLDSLPNEDHESRRIVSQMKEDEARHATHADQLGGIKLPKPVSFAMKICAKIMTKTAYHI